MASLTILIKLRVVRIFGSVVGRYSSSIGVFAQICFGGVHDQIQMSGLNMELKDKIQEGWVGTGDRGRMVVGWMGVHLGVEHLRMCPRSSSSSYKCITMSSIGAQ